MSVKSSIGNPEFLKKRVVPNPKYHYVRARIDTGHSLSKYMEKIEELRKNYRYKRDELFKRLKVTTFAQLVLQVASVNEQGERVFSEQQQEEGSHSVLSAPEPELLAIKDNEERHPMEVHQKSPIELISNEDSVEKPLSARSTLQRLDIVCLLVLFSVTAYNLDPVASLPSSRLCQACTHSTEGLKVVAQTFPEGLTTGSIPLSCQPPVFLPSRQRQSTPQELLRPAEDKLRFANDDLSKIQHYLDEILVPSNSPSSFSHLSSSRTQLKSSSSSVRAQTGSIQNKPWK
ncbi:hypothetical protein chiPu_0008531 [Chiloscyllium punctatum]|uniref:Centrosomal protein of 41 kDa n=1 Tax=Chiloscyllium punctatum TaxID=137246 RepID=A0A401SI59_CHIPU|nr:hypothetical protein [Chiloscyllium punctatum]